MPVATTLQAPTAGLAGPKKEEASRTRQAAVREQVKNALAQGNYAAARQALDVAFHRAPVPELLLLLARLWSRKGRWMPGSDAPLSGRPGAAQRREPSRGPAGAGSLPPPLSSEVRVLGDAGAVVVVDQRTVGVPPLTSPLCYRSGRTAWRCSIRKRRSTRRSWYSRARHRSAQQSHKRRAMLLSQLPTVSSCSTLPAWRMRRGASSGRWPREAAADEQVTVLRPEVALTAAPELRTVCRKLRCWRQLAAGTRPTSCWGRCF